MNADYSGYPIVAQDSLFKGFSEMSELSFAKQFLTALDSRPIKISADHVADPKNYPAQGAYILPRMPNEKSKPNKNVAPGATPAATTLSVTIKSLKSTPAPVTLESQDQNTSIHELKSSYASQANLSVDKIKLLWKKKPVSDTKTLKELLTEAGEESTPTVELNAMVMGGGAATTTTAGAAETPKAADPPEVAMTDADADGAPVAQGPSGTEVLQSEEFWKDLKGYLVVRLKDEKEGERLAGVFREAWEKSR